MRRRAILLFAVVGCGDNAAALDAGVTSDASAPCTATFRGNFAETSSGAADCPTVTGDNTLAFSVPSTTLGASLAIAIGLGPSPTTGWYSPETTSQWSAVAFERLGDGICEYSAGAAATPAGSFGLSLTAIDGSVVHGTLAITQYVLTVPGTDCGDGDTETVTLDF